ncbi:MAG: thiamine-phosphate kinase [Hyphomicrobiaceae bacterium]
MANLHKTLGEANLIQTYFAPLTAGAPGAYGLTDDCASLTPPDGQDLILSTDAVIEGIHFLADEDPASIGAKAIAVNVSDVVSKGARPLVYLMNLSFPSQPSQSWLQAFAAGLRSAQFQYGCHLTGGDTDKTTGPLSVSITMVATVAKGQMVRRNGAKPGDIVFVTGPIGDATLGLRLARGENSKMSSGLGPTQISALVARYRRPQPVLNVADILPGHVSAAMDVSDGLLKDFGHLCAASKCGGRLDLAQMPVSDAARTVMSTGNISYVDLATGGEDYVVLGCVAPEKHDALKSVAAKAGVEITMIGQIRPIEEGVQFIDALGQNVSVTQSGWDHFSNQFDVNS